MVKVQGANDAPICINDIELIAPPRYGESAEVLAANLVLVLFVLFNVRKKHCRAI